MAFVSEFLAYGGLILQVIALILLIRGPWTRYFPLVLYLFSFIAVTLGIAWVYRSQGVANSLYFNFYWGGEILTDLLSFFLVISLTARALEGNPLRAKLIRIMSIVLLVALIVPFVAFDSVRFGRHWFQSVGQLFNFGAAVMNMALWSALVLSKQRDRQLLTVSAGLGVTVAGAALALGVRQFTAQDDVLRTLTDYVYRACQIASPAIWCWAFRPAKPKLTSSGIPTTAAV